MLRGQKVILRAIERDDLRRLWEIRNDEAVEVMAFGPPIPRSMAEMEAWFDKRLAESDSNVFAIEVDGQVVGSCNLRDIDLVHRRAELGITLASEAIGKGYGSDSIRVLLDLAFTHLNLHKVSLDTLASNQAGLRAYRACGFVETGRMRQHEWFEGRWDDLVMMDILRDEWLARPAEAAARDA
jgi:RimJ/RimL family protein N-acetyltransferase